METAGEKPSEDDGKLSRLCFVARAEGTFGQNLTGLSGVYLSDLKTIIAEALRSEINSFASGLFRKIILSARGRLSKLTGIDDLLPKPIMVLQKLMKELEEQSGTKGVGTVPLSSYELD